MTEQKKDTNNSSFPGPIAGIPDIAVDNFTEINKKAYFLSHFHGDHTEGLFQNHDGNIYMSETTFDILKNFCYSDRMYQNLSVEVLETGKTYKNFKNLGFDVTLVPVVHMPGAVMFFFKSSDGKKILYTGDFVLQKGDLSNQFKDLHEEIEGEQTPMTFDLMYYDDTFDNKTLPERSVCIKEATALIRRWLTLGDDRQVVFHRPYNYGFEDLFTGICESLETDPSDEPSFRQTIFLDENEGTVNSQIPLYGKILKPKGNVYTDNIRESKLRICTEKEKHSACRTDDENTLHFFIYTLYWRYNNATYEKSINKYDLCFPTHCSKEQLEDFFGYFKADRRISFSEAKRNNPKTPLKNQQSTSTSMRPMKYSNADPESQERVDSAKRKLDY